MSTLAHRERVALCDTLTAVGPDAPTLCGTWTTRDLAAHLIVRERRPAAVGIAVPQLSGWTESSQESVARRPYEDLVATVRSGPPRWSPMRLRRVDAVANTFEYFVHHEDIRRAQLDWSARTVSEADEATLQALLAQRASLFLRRARQRVVLDAGDFGSVVVGDGEQVTVTGPSSELALYVHGRTDHALVTVTGDHDAVDDFRSLRLSI